MIDKRVMDEGERQKALNEVKNCSIKIGVFTVLFMLVATLVLGFMMSELFPIKDAFMRNFVSYIVGYYVGGCFFKVNIEPKMMNKLFSTINKNMPYMNEEDKRKMKELKEETVRKMKK